MVFALLMLTLLLEHEGWEVYQEAEAEEMSQKAGSRPAVECLEEQLCPIELSVMMEAFCNLCCLILWPAAPSY